MNSCKKTHTSHNLFHMQYKVNEQEYRGYIQS